MTTHVMTTYTQIPQDDPPQPHWLGALNFPSISSQIDASPHSPIAGLVSCINLAKSLYRSSHRGEDTLHSSLSTSPWNSISPACKYNQSSMVWKRWGLSCNQEGDFPSSVAYQCFLYLTDGICSLSHTLSTLRYWAYGHRASLASYCQSSALQVPLSLSASPRSAYIQVQTFL